MQVGSVSMSEFRKYDRMDAEFHLAVQSVAAEVAVLEKQGNAEALIQHLQKISVQDLGVSLKPLLTGSSKPSERTLTTAIRKYPYVAYALVLQGRDSMVKFARARIADEQEYLARLEALPAVGVADS